MAKFFKVVYLPVSLYYDGYDREPRIQFCKTEEQAKRIENETVVFEIRPVVFEDEWVLAVEKYRAKMESLYDCHLKREIAGVVGRYDPAFEKRRKRLHTKVRDILVPVYEVGNQLHKDKLDFVNKMVCF